jgi:hypothetical protein
MTKGGMLGARSKSMVSMTRMWEASSESRDSLFVPRVKISEQKELHFKIANLKKPHDLGIISEERLKDQVLMEL